MTRKELIQQEADIKFPDNPVAQARFKDGAEWADKNPSENNIAMYLGKKGWPLSTYGIPTYEEAAKALDEYYEYKRKQWIRQACKWLEDNITEYCDGENLEFHSDMTFNIDCLFQSKLVEDFKKAMEK